MHAPRNIVKPVLLVDDEITRRTNDRWHCRIKSASFPLQATLEDLDLSAGRGLKRAQILDDRNGRSATLFATQVPVSKLHAYIPGPTIADSALDRLIHNAYRLNLSGDSMRKTHPPLDKDDN